ncbi:MAG: glycosyltransferase family 2 protein [Leptolyngbyaceae cyanobacterium]
MKFSLVVATLHRVAELDRFLQSLVTQSYQNFEVIIIDQNSDDRLVNLIDAYREMFPITHVQTATPGVSRARNQGRLLAQGDIVGFPDDDCLYPADLLAKVAHFFQTNSIWDGLTIRVKDLESDQDAFDYCLKESGKVNDYTVWSVGIGPAMFFRTALAQSVAFDEEMGPGATWVGGEDTDYLLHCLDHNAAVYYDSELFVRHPRPYAIYSIRQLVSREFTYGRGFGYLLRKRAISLSIVLQQLFAPLPLLVQYTVAGNFRYALPCPGMGVGRILGYWEGIRKYRRSLP